MNSQKTIRQFIGPNWIPTIILIVFFPLIVLGLLVLLFITLPAAIRTKKSIGKLEAAGLLDKAAAELTSPSAKRYMNGKLILTDHFVFSKRSGMVFTYDEILWAYKHRFTQRVLFIPIKVTDSLYVGTKDYSPRALASMGKDKMDEIVNAIVEIHKHNNNCIVGYGKEKQAAYKQLCK